MSYNKTWSQDEDKVLLNLVEKHPHNLKKAFTLASEELSRSLGACSNRWYQTLSRREDTKVFYCISKTRVGKNRKNCVNKLTVTEKRTWWKDILNKLFK